MKRVTTVRPGHDCIYAPCKLTPPCEPPPSGQNHGIAGDEWRFSVVADDGLSAMSLLIFSAVYPSSIPDRHFDRPQRHMSAHCGLHLAFPTSTEDLLRRDVDSCDLLPGGRCYPIESSIHFARRFFEDHGDKAARTPEQPESFWTALEAAFIRWDEECRANRVDLAWQKCPHCDGLGTVRKP